MTPPTTSSDLFRHTHTHTHTHNMWVREGGVDEQIQLLGRRRCAHLDRFHNESIFSLIRAYFSGLVSMNLDKWTRPRLDN
jgi:hypothetical protein